MLMVAVVSYGSFFFLFLALGIPAMPLVNLGMVGVSALSLALLDRQHPNLATVTGSAMVLIHAACATLVMGWSTEFHLYAFLLLVFLMLSPTFSANAKFAIFSALTAGYVLAWQGFSNDPVEPQVSAQIQRLFSTLNLIVFSLLTALLSTIYATASSRTADEYEALNAELERLATTDPLTGLLNRRHLREMLLQEFVRYQRTQRTFAVIIGDLDDFKAVNDVQGHQGGDSVLVAVSGAIRQSVRGHDLVARWGGEEFLIFLPETAEEEAVGVARRIQSKLADTKVAYKNNLLEVRMTMGLAVARPGRSIEELLQLADEALYRGKRAGKDRIELAADLALE